MNCGSCAEPSNTLKGKVAIITGGASEIGSTSVEIFHKNAAKVVIADVQDDVGHALANKLGGKYVCYIHCDVSNEDDIIKVVETTVTKYGNLDIMYNNAGVLDCPSGSILDTAKADLERVLGVNTVGGFLGAKHAAKVMVKQGKGCILFTSNACTEIGGLGSLAYVVSKYGIVGLMKSLEVELGQYGIRVNSVSPYGVVTGMCNREGVDPAILEAQLSEMSNLKGHVLKTEGVAHAALYLASDEASYVSGQNLVVDGGFSIVNPTIMKALKLIKLFFIIASVRCVS